LVKNREREIQKNTTIVINSYKKYILILLQNIFDKNYRYSLWFKQQSNRAITTTSKLSANSNMDNILNSQAMPLRGLHLINGLKVLLISDSTTDKSAAALSVEVGHMCDPEEIPGLAHFCEHMLFLGTKKFPNENDYTSFLSENSGSSNAGKFNVDI
jgi:hypothetical protein